MTRHPTLRAGDTGGAVMLLQHSLNDRLALDPALEADGLFGRATVEAVVALQSSGVGSDGRPLMVDGVVGPQTWWALTTPDTLEAFGPSPRSVQRVGRATGPLARQVIAVAVHERASGAREVGGDNLGPWVEKYARGKSGGAWCAHFVSWCVREAAQSLGHDMPFGYTGGARNMRDQLHAAGLALPTDAEPEPGHLVFWWREAPDSWKGHVGIVTDVADGMMWTIEGNRGAYPCPVRQFSYVIERERRLLGFARLE